VAYVWRHGAEQGLVLDGVPLPPFRDGLVSELSIDDAGRLTFVASRADGACVVRHGVPQPLFAHVTKLVVTGAGHYAYVGHQAKRAHVVIDGIARATADAVEDVLPSPDGRRFVLLLRRGQGWLVADDRGEASFDRVIAGSLAWSRDSENWGVIAGDTRSQRIFISIDGHEQRPFDMRELVLLAEQRPKAGPDEATAALQALVAAEVDTAKGNPRLCPRSP
jgi:hypothetical protein